MLKTKHIAMLLAVALMLSFIAGCGQTTPSPAPAATTTAAAAAEATTAAAEGAADADDDEGDANDADDAADATTAAAAATTAAAAATTTAAAATTAAATAGAADGLDPVVLTIYYLGDGSVDDQEVINVLNAKTSELINTTMDRKLISWADFNTRYPLVFASGEDFDMIFTSNWSFYAQMAMSGGFHEITMDLLAAHAPNLYEKVPEAAWRQARINGKIYMIPNTQEEFNTLGILIRGDLRKKYGMPELASLDDFEEYLDQIANNEAGMMAFDGGAEFDRWVNGTLWFYDLYNYRSSAVTGYSYKTTDTHPTLVKTIEIPEYKEYLAKMVDFNNRGYWSRSALNNEVRMDDAFINGRSGAALHNVGTMINAARRVQDNNPEWEPEIYDSTFNSPDAAIVRTSFLGNGMGVHARSNQLERSLMWLDLIRFDQECYDLMMNGIEGKHWIDAGPGLSDRGPNAGDYGSYSTWGFTTEEMKRRDINEWPNWHEIFTSFQRRTVDVAAPYFLFNDTDYKNEVAAMTELSQRYSQIFDFGFEPNWESAIWDVDALYESAGRAAVLEEVVKQMDVFLAEYYN